MTVLNKKSIMVSFRLSLAEYEAARRRCEESGVRSVSSLARTATLGLLPSFLGKPPENSKFEYLEEQIYKLRGEIERLSGLICVSDGAEAR
jgi:hypothetical protein